MIIPTIPPIIEIRVASIKNCKNISIFLAPSALRTPISLIRSVNETSIILAIPIPATNREIPATRPINICKY